VSRRSGSERRSSVREQPYREPIAAGDGLASQGSARSRERVNDKWGRLERSV